MNKDNLEKLGLSPEQSEKIIEIFNSELNSIKINYAVESALINAGAKNLTACRALIDFSNIKIEDDKIIGIDEQINKLIDDKSSSFLFSQKNKNYKGAIPEESRGLTNSKDFKNMTYTEMCQYLNK